jgi:hypothetical protein
MKEKPSYKIIDAFPAFLEFWAKAALEPIDRQVDDWAAVYMRPWPELLSKQIDNYVSQDADWRQIAREKVFPHLNERLPDMQAARTALLEYCGSILFRTQQKLAFDQAVTFVIYVGIGCGAGWASTFEGVPAVLFGLENIAECGWSDPETIRGLIAHELGHLVHQHWRLQQGLSSGSGPWWDLYEEGFAQACEGRISDMSFEHQSVSENAGDWLAWCQEHSAWLASEFLSRVEAGRPVVDFFGSWFDICGKSETGYYLGREVIRALEQQQDLHEIALLEQIEPTVRPIMERMAGRA